MTNGNLDGRFWKEKEAAEQAAAQPSHAEQKEAALIALAAGLLQDADETGRCAALYSRAFESGVAFCIRTNGFASFLPDDRAEQERALRRFFAPYLRRPPQEIADEMTLYEARCRFLTVRAACRRAAGARSQRGALLSSADEQALRQALLSAAAPFAAANRRGWIALDLSEAESDLAYAAGRAAEPGLDI